MNFAFLESDDHNPLNKYPLSVADSIALEIIKTINDWNSLNIASTLMPNDLDWFISILAYSLCRESLFSDAFAIYLQWIHELPFPELSSDEKQVYLARFFSKFQCIFAHGLLTRESIDRFGNVLRIRFITPQQNYSKDVWTILMTFLMKGTLMLLSESKTSDEKSKSCWELSAKFAVELIAESPFIFENIFDIYYDQLFQHNYFVQLWTNRLSHLYTKYLNSETDDFHLNYFTHMVDTRYTKSNQNKAFSKIIGCCGNSTGLAILTDPWNSDEIVSKFGSWFHPELNDAGVGPLLNLILQGTPNVELQEIANQVVLEKVALSSQYCTYLMAHRDLIPHIIDHIIEAANSSSGISPSTSSALIPLIFVAYQITHRQDLLPLLSIQFDSQLCRWEVMFSMLLIDQPQAFWQTMEAMMVYETGKLTQMLLFAALSSEIVSTDYGIPAFISDYIWDEINSFQGVDLERFLMSMFFLSEKSPYFRAHPHKMAPLLGLACVPFSEMVRLSMIGGHVSEEQDIGAETYVTTDFIISVVGDKIIIRHGLGSIIYQFEECAPPPMQTIDADPVKPSPVLPISDIYQSMLGVSDDDIKLIEDLDFQSTASQISPRETITKPQRPLGHQVLANLGLFSSESTDVWVVPPDLYDDIAELDRTSGGIKLEIPIHQVDNDGNFFRSDTPHFTQLMEDLKSTGDSNLLQVDFVSPTAEVASPMAIILNESDKLFNKSADVLMKIGLVIGLTPDTDDFIKAEINCASLGANLVKVYIKRNLLRQALVMMAVIYLSGGEGTDSSRGPRFMTTGYVNRMTKIFTIYKAATAKTISQHPKKDPMSLQKELLIDQCCQ